MKARIPGAQQGGGNMMKKLQDMQAAMEKAQADVEATDFTATAGGGVVEVVVSGAHEVKSINIDPEVVDPEDTEMLSDMIIAAVNEAMRKSEEAMSKAMESVQGGLGLPPGLGLPF